ncbi:MAG: hemerythrin domain-containing protein [Pyrinomonadaceae bacterium]|nr:hemerythrin domain-containing protein [Pyrinomonadaceae bacterium]
MNVFEEIKKDHEKQREMMNRIADTEGDSKEREDAFSQFENELNAHALAEEQTFYASLMEDPDGTEKARHSVAEHKKAIDIIGELKKTSMSSSGWLINFNKLKAENEHHMEEEENEVFTRAKKVLSENETNDLGKAFRERKNAELDS